MDWATDRALQTVFEAFCETSGRIRRKELDEASFIELCCDSALLDDDFTEKDAHALFQEVAVDDQVLTIRSFLTVLTILAARSGRSLDWAVLAVLESEGPSRLAAPHVALPASPPPRPPAAASPPPPAPPGQPGTPPRAAVSAAVSNAAAALEGCVGRGGRLDRDRLAQRLQLHDGAALREAATVLQDAAEQCDRLAGGAPNAPRPEAAAWETLGHGKGNGGLGARREGAGEGAVLAQTVQSKVDAQLQRHLAELRAAFSEAVL